MAKLDHVIQQLNNHHETISSIQAIQDSHSAMLETLAADNINIKASINHIISSLSSLATKLNIQITLPQPLRLSPASPTLPPAAVASSTTPSSPSVCIRPESAPSSLYPNNSSSILESSPKYILQPSNQVSSELPCLEPPFDDQGISYHVPIGATNLKVMQLSTSIFNNPTAALVDSGTSRNDLHQRTAIILGLKIDRSITFSNTMGNDEKMKSKGLSCNNHILFLIGLAEGKIKTCERKLYIFDPGGSFTKAAKLFDEMLRRIYGGKSLCYQLPATLHPGVTIVASISWESFEYALPNLKLALPSAIMVCPEYIAFEILVLLAGLMPNSEVSTSLVAICVNTEAIAYMITYGFGATVSTRVSNEIGAGNIKKAKSAISVTLKLSCFLALTVLISDLFCQVTYEDLQPFAAKLLAFDLEDKVDLEGVSNDTHTTIPSTQDSAHTNTRPKRMIQMPRRYLE